MKAGGFKLGTFFGIELRLDYSWFLLLALVTWSFAALVLPLQLPGAQAATLAGLGLLSALLFFLSVVIHEFAHALYAKHKGRSIDRITLFLFGGASEIQDEAKRPGEEFIMAALGPIASFALTGVFALVWYLAQQAGSAPVSAVAAVLASVNLILGLFNLLPGYPLDGGRLLRAAAWKLTGDLVEATRIASFGGKLVAFLLVLYGALQFLAGSPLGGAWLILIGLFLSWAAGASYRQLVLQERLKDVTVGDIMNRDIAAIPARTRISEALDRHAEQGEFEALPVAASASNRAGLVFLEQLQDAPPSQAIGERVPDGMVSLHPGEAVATALRALQEQGLPEMPVVEDGRFVGVLSLNRIQGYVAAAETKRTLGRRDADGRP